MTDARNDSPRPPAGTSSALVLAAPSWQTGKLARRNRHEQEFLPAVLELVETPVSPTYRWTALSICGLCSAAIEVAQEIWTGWLSGFPA